jgi:hypothetical protein
MIMSELQLQQASNGRPIKFTPERFAQIRNLVERGMAREEIAATIGCTVGSLQVTCSRHGISLRRPKVSFVLRPASVAATTTSVPAMTEPPTTKTSLALLIRLRGREKILDMNLPDHVISSLAVEASVKDISIAQLIASLLIAHCTNGR